MGIPKDEKVVRLSDHISKNFYPLFSRDNPITQPYRVFKGGRSSLKSSSISLKLVKDFLEDDEANIVCLRKVAKYLSNSVYEQIKWAIYTLGVQEEFKFLKSPMKIIHKPTDTAFFFYGVDDPQKIKSHKIAKGYVSRLWFEEAAEFEGVEEIDIVTDTFIREDLPEGQQVEVYFSYNPPRNPYVWINEWIPEIEEDDDYYVHHSTYEDDTIGVLSQQFLKKIATIKKNDPDYHDWMYGGKVTGLGDVIYNIKLFQKIQSISEISDDERIVFADVAIDPGHSVSATAYLFIGITNKMNVVLLDTFYYEPANKLQKKAPSELSEELWKFVQENITKFDANIDTWTIDSAEGALRNQVFNMYSLVLTPAKKKKKHKMIDSVTDLLAQGRVYVLETENNEVFYDEHKKYRWDEDTLKKDDPKVIKEYDHTCDAFQYFVNNNLQKLNLSV